MNLKPLKFSDIREIKQYIGIFYVIVLMTIGTPTLKLLHFYVCSNIQEGKKQVYTCM